MTLDMAMGWLSVKCHYRCTLKMACMQGKPEYKSKYSMRRHQPPLPLSLVLMPCHSQGQQTFKTSRIITLSIDVRCHGSHPWKANRPEILTGWLGLPTPP